MALRTFLSDRGDTGRRLDLVLRRHLADLESATRTRVQTWIDRGTVSINGRAVRRVATRVAAGDVLTVDIPEFALFRPRAIEPDPLPIEILFEDNHLLAVNKPTGIVVHPTHAQPAGTLMNALMWHGRGWRAGLRPSIVGRLDKLTSGIVLVAKTAAIHAALQKTMARRETEKDYLALVYGRVPAATTDIALRLRRDSVDRRRMVTSESIGAPSLTLVTRLWQVAAPRVGLALLRCRLVTGRTHQIRAHLAARGWPIVGDPVYGEPQWSRVNNVGLSDSLRAFPRQALHAWRLAFVHPQTSAPVIIEAPVPEDMRALLERIGFYEVRQGSTRFVRVPRGSTRFSERTRQNLVEPSRTQ
jgi:23S rRNA pseudouridine1911/1915/1917 synthase